jgi:hypothetical protein
VKISSREPAERPYTIALSAAEVVALVKYHVAHCKRIPKDLGKAQLEAGRGSFFVPKHLNAKLVSAAKEQLEAHTTRAQGLASILK